MKASVLVSALIAVISTFCEYDERSERHFNKSRQIEIETHRAEGKLR